MRLIVADIYSLKSKKSGQTPLQMIEISSIPLNTLTSQGNPFLEALIKEIEQIKRGEHGN